MAKIRRFTATNRHFTTKEPGCGSNHSNPFLTQKPKSKRQDDVAVRFPPPPRGGPPSPDHHQPRRIRCLSLRGDHSQRPSDGTHGPQPQSRHPQLKSGQQSWEQNDRRGQGLRLSERRHQGPEGADPAPPPPHGRCRCQWFVRGIGGIFGKWLDTSSFLAGLKYQSGEGINDPLQTSHANSVPMNEWSLRPRLTKETLRTTLL